MHPLGRIAAAACGSVAVSGRSVAAGKPAQDSGIGESYGPLLSAAQELFSIAQPYLAIWGLISICIFVVLYLEARCQDRERDEVAKANRGER